MKYSSPEISLKIRRTFLPWGYGIEYCFNSQLDQKKLNRLTAGCINRIIPELGRPNDEIEDLKGLQVSRLSLTQLSLPQSPSNEIFFLSASMPPLPSDAQDEASEEQQESAPPLKLHLSVRTEYKGLLKKGHVAHRLAISRSPAVPNEIFIRDLIELPDVTIDYFSLGAEIFYPQFFSSALGLAPLATEKFSMQASAEKLTMTIESVGLKNRNTLPLQKNQLFNKLSKLLTATLDFDLTSDYLKRCY